MPGDLHTPSTYSDGSTPVDKLPFLAACAGMTHLAVSSDHDSIQSVRYAYAHPVQNGVHLIPATELTAYDYERAHRVHLLCYWPDDCAPLADFAAMMAERRLTAMLQSCKELELNLPPVPHRGKRWNSPGTAARCSKPRSCGCCGSTAWPTVCIIRYTNRFSA